MTRRDLRRAADQALERASESVAHVQVLALRAAETGDPHYLEAARQHLRFARAGYERWRALNRRQYAN